MGQLILNDDVFKRGPITSEGDDPYAGTKAISNQLILTDDVFTRGPIVETPEPVPEIKPESGLFQEVGKDLGRGVAELGRLAGSGIKTLDPDGGIDILDNIGQKMVNAADKLSETEFLKRGEEKGFVSRGIHGGIESSIPSLAPLAAGLASGAATGLFFGPVGAAIGGFAGMTAATLGLFGLGTYGQKKDEYLSQGIDPEKAHKAALQQAFVEGGIEEASNLIGLLTFGFGKAATQPLKQTARELLSTPLSTFAKNLVKNTALNEVPTEMLQGALGTGIESNLGLQEEGAWVNSMVESIIPAMTMSVLFSAGAQGITSAQRLKVKKDLNHDDPVRRTKAANYVSASLKSDPDLQQAWDTMASSLIKNNEPIDLTFDFAAAKEEEADRIISEEKFKQDETVSSDDAQILAIMEAGLNDPNNDQITIERIRALQEDEATAHLAPQIQSMIDNYEKKQTKTPIEPEHQEIIKEAISENIDDLSDKIQNDIDAEIAAANMGKGSSLTPEDKAILSQAIPIDEPVSTEGFDWSQTIPVEELSQDEKNNLVDQLIEIENRGTETDKDFADYNAVADQLQGRIDGEELASLMEERKKIFEKLPVSEGKEEKKDTEKPILERVVAPKEITAIFTKENKAELDTLSKITSENLTDNDIARIMELEEIKERHSKRRKDAKVNSEKLYKEKINRLAVDVPVFKTKKEVLDFVDARRRDFHKEQMSYVDSTEYKTKVVPQLKGFKKSSEESLKEKQPETIETFQNKEDGVETIVTKGLEDGKFHVTLKDESGEILPSHFIFDKKEDAIAKAKEIYGPEKKEKKIIDTEEIKVDKESKPTKPANEKGKQDQEAKPKKAGYKAGGKAYFKNAGALVPVELISFDKDEKTWKIRFQSGVVLNKGENELALTRPVLRGNKKTAQKAVDKFNEEHPEALLKFDNISEMPAPMSHRPDVIYITPKKGSPAAGRTFGIKADNLTQEAILKEYETQKKRAIKTEEYKAEQKAKEEKPLNLSDQTYEETAIDEQGNQITYKANAQEEVQALDEQAGILERILNCMGQ